VVLEKMIKRKEDNMAVKVLIKRSVPRDKARDMIPLFKQMRVQANDQPGYISGETLRSLDRPEEFLVISTLESSNDWKNGDRTPERDVNELNINHVCNL